MSGVDDLAAWLTAVWDEEERQFEAACEAEAEYLRGDGLPDATAASVREFWLSPEAGMEWPLRLARIAADRKILAEHAPSDGNCRTCCGEPYCEVYWDGEEETVVWQRKALAWPCPTIRLKAEQYAARPDFPEWLVERQEARAVSDRRAD